jgi:hypothetical protein
MNVEAFLTGFFESRGEEIDIKKAEAKEEEKRLRALAQANAAKVQQRKTVYDSATKMTKDLLSWGMAEDQLKAAVGSGNLDRLYKDAASIRNSLGAEEAQRFLSDDMFTADLGTAEFSDLNEAVRTVYGMPTTGTKGDLKAKETGFFGRILGGRDYEGERLAKLDEEMSLVNGMSTYDLANIGVLPSYIPGSQGETFAYSSPMLYNNETRDKALDRMQDYIDDIAGNEELSGLASKVRDISVKLATEYEGTEGSDLYQEAVAQRDAAVKAYGERFMELGGDLLFTEAERYFNSSAYYADMANYLKAKVPGIPDDIIGILNQTAEEAKAVEDAVQKQTTTGADATDTTGAAIPTGDPASDTVASVTVDGDQFEVKIVDGEEVAFINGQPASPEDNEAAIKGIKDQLLSSRLDGKDGSQKVLERYEEIFKYMEGVPEEQHTLYMEKAMELAEQPGFTEFMQDLGFELGEVTGDTLTTLDKAYAAPVAATVYGVGMLDAGLGNLVTFLTGDVGKGTMDKLKGEAKMEEARKMMSEGMYSYILNRAEEQGLDVSEKAGEIYDFINNKVLSKTSAKSLIGPLLKGDFSGPAYLLEGIGKGLEKAVRPAVKGFMNRDLEPEIAPVYEGRGEAERLAFEERRAQQNAVAGR